MTATTNTTAASSASDVLKDTRAVDTEVVDTVVSPVVRLKPKLKSSLKKDSVYSIPKLS